MYLQFKKYFFKFFLWYNFVLKLWYNFKNNKKEKIPSEAGDVIKMCSDFWDQKWTFYPIRHGSVKS